MNIGKSLLALSLGATAILMVCANAAFAGDVLASEAASGAMDGAIRGAIIGGLVGGVAGLFGFLGKKKNKGDDKNPKQ